MHFRKNAGLVARAIIGAATSITLMATWLPVAAGQEAPSCLQTIPSSDLHKGDTGYGITVADGTEREKFDVKVLGVLQDALGPGRNLVIIEASGSVIDDVGSIWYGISGSPIYINDRLAGSISYGLAGGPSKLAGVTPAEDIARVWNYPAAPQDTGVHHDSIDRVEMSPQEQQQISQSTSENVGGALVPLRVPLGISGLSDLGLKSMAQVFKRESLPFIPYSSSAADSNQSDATPATDIQAGDNIAATLSYGDITSAGVGTVTAACDGKLIAFGHPFFWQGPTTFGANASESIAVVQDPIFGPYELGTIGAPIGRIDQDRLAGIRGFVGEIPTTVPITSSVSDADTGFSRDGKTSVIHEEEVPFFAFYHLYSNIQVAMDRYGEGSSTMSYTLSGTREDGSTWQLTSDNMYSSEYDIAGETSYELEYIPYSLLFNNFEDVRLTSVSANAHIEDEQKDFRITGVEVSLDGIDYVDRHRIKAEPGDTVFLRVTLSPSDEGADQTVDLSVDVPARPRGDATIEITGPQSSFDEICFYRPRRCRTSTGEKIDSFDDLLAQLQQRPKNNQLTASLRMGERRSATASDSEILDRVVSGRKRVTILLASRSRRGKASSGEVSKPTP